MPKAWRNRIVGHGEETPDQLLANPANWRIHPKVQQSALSGVLGEIGWIQNVIVNRTTGHVVDGHLRVELAISRNEPTVPVVYVELTEAEEKLALATIDPLSALAVTDADKLGELLAGIESDSPLVQALMESIAADNHIATAAQAVSGDDAEQIDRAEELQAKWQVKRGDLWTIGDHRLLCGDSTNADDVARVMGGQKASLLINDPPYGMRLDADFSGMKSGLKSAKDKGAFGGRRYDNVTGDHDDYDARPILKLFEHVPEQFWFGADYYSSTLGDTMHGGSWLVWDKRLDESADKMYGSCFELIWSRQKHKRDILRIKWAGVFGMEKEQEKMRVHPNQKPSLLIGEIINRYSNAADLVVDCYSGSGTTLVACQQTGRHGRAIELEPKYVAVALERLSLMGLTPVLNAMGANDGRQ